MSDMKIGYEENYFLKSIMRKLLIVTCVLVFVALDMLSKAYFEGLLSHGEKIALFSDLITLRLSYNSGVAFSFPIEGAFLVWITIIILAGLIFYYIKEEYKKNLLLLDISYVLIFAGAFSHAYERIFIGHVVDFIAVKYFAILNFADILISVGAIILVFAYGFSSGSGNRK
ncbi:MAG: signal peptidase II [Candidatus Altimarinota bacterium]